MQSFTKTEVTWMIQELNGLASKYQTRLSREVFYISGLSNAPALLKNWHRRLIMGTSE